MFSLVCNFFMLFFHKNRITTSRPCSSVCLHAFFFQPSNRSQSNSERWFLSTRNFDHIHLPLANYVSLKYHCFCRLSTHGFNSSFLLLLFQPTNCHCWKCCAPSPKQVIQYLLPSLQLPLPPPHPLFTKSS